MESVTQKVVDICIGRFHHFHLARQLEKRGLLDSIWTGYPMRKLRDEPGVPVGKIHTFPWLQAPFMARYRLRLHRWKWLGREWAWRANETLDWRASFCTNRPVTVVALSGAGLRAGRQAQRHGGHYICDRGSSHIAYQDNLLKEEYRRWGLEFYGIDPRMKLKEEREYEQADFITVPSEFVKRSFIESGVPQAKLMKVPYGARLERFRRVCDPNPDTFQILWVGSVSIRKGFIYLLEAFRKLRHPRKRLVVAGGVDPDIVQLLDGCDTSGIQFLGQVANSLLPRLYSESDAFVLPSIEEGLAVVQGEALACGCPVIASVNTGAEDLFRDGVEGFIIPIRSSSAILSRLEQLMSSRGQWEMMSAAALSRVASFGGWDAYGCSFESVLNALHSTRIT